MTVYFFNEMMVIVDVRFCFVLFCFNDVTWQYKELAIPY